MAAESPATTPRPHRDQRRLYRMYRAAAVVEVIALACAFGAVCAAHDADPLWPAFQSFQERYQKDGVATPSLRFLVFLNNVDRFVQQNAKARHLVMPRNT